MKLLREEIDSESSGDENGYIKYEDFCNYCIQNITNLCPVHLNANSSEKRIRKLPVYEHVKAHAISINNNQCQTSTSNTTEIGSDLKKRYFMSYSEFKRSKINYEDNGFKLNLPPKLERS
uniref:Uncharacterized protein n=1 Tax=Aplanochytrium stocchinoi TaxID=215587 RepID=A0A7S3LLK4_9STRA